MAGTLTAARRPVIAGLGITEMGRVYGRSAEDFAAAAVRLAVADAGLDLSDVDGLLTNAGLVGGVGLGLQRRLQLRDLSVLSEIQSYGASAGAMVSYAAMAHVSLEAAAVLAKEGIEAEVIDLRTLLPLDRETILESVKKTNRLLVVHEDTRTGGIAGEIAAIVCEEAFGYLDAPISRVTALDTPVPYSPPLEERFLPNAEKVVAAARELAKY